MTSASEPSSQIDASVYIAPGAQVVGDVTIGADSSVWYNAVIRADTTAIRIGSQTNVQDLCLLHADPGFPCTLGDRVTVGHAAIVHGATIEDDVMIGMRAVLLNGVKVGTGSVIAAGAVLVEGMEIPPHSVVMGMPGRVKRPAAEQDAERIRHAAEHYADLARQRR